MNLYWLFVIGNLKDSLEFLCGLSWFLAVVGFFVAVFISAIDEDLQHIKKYISFIFKKCVVFWLFFIGLVNVFAPSETQLITIFAADYASDIEGIHELPENVIKALNFKLEEVVNAGASTADSE